MPLTNAIDVPQEEREIRQRFIEMEYRLTNMFNGPDLRRQLRELERQYREELASLRQQVSGLNLISDNAPANNANNIAGLNWANDTVNYWVTYSDDATSQLSAISYNQAVSQELAGRLLTYTLTPEELALKTKLTEEQKQERIERMASIKKIKERLVNGTAEDVKSLVRCGFELETQESDGIDSSTRSIDEDRFEEAVIENSEYYLINAKFLMEHLKDLNIAKFHDPRRDTVNFNELSELLSESKIEQLRELAIETSRNNMSSGDFVIPHNEHFNLKNVQLEYDGSVDGFEFKTKGPKTISEFKEAAKEIFGVEHNIDERCSFHIHLSIDGIKHNYGEQLQLLLMEGVLKQADKIPSSVLQRWRAGFEDMDDCGRYFQWKVEHDKYVAISRHHTFNTWEFRCFGNVQNYKDATVCLKIAINALKYAYERQLLRAGPMILDFENVSEIAEQIANVRSWADIVSEYSSGESQAA